MKKVVVLLAAVSLLATSAFAASVVGSRHDMSTGGVEGFATGTDKVCVFCHTPHAANISNPNAPLWNRSGAATITQFYNSATLDTESQPNTVSASVLASDAPLCLSCHDGSTIDDPLRNPPNGTTMDYGPLAPASSLDVDSTIGTDLRDDHPIGMVYNTIYDNTPTEFKNASTVTVDLVLYNGGKMWCSSCHDVHDPANTPFLAKSNAASGLCTTCHTK